MNDFTAAPAEATGDPDAAYAAALETAMNAPTPQARAKAVDALEVLARQRVEAAPAGAAAGQQNAEPLEGFEGPSSGLAYQFEQALPPGVEITDTAALGTLKGSLAEAGVPVEIGNAAFADIARLNMGGTYASEAAYLDACGTCRAQLEKVHGEGAKSLIADAVAWLEGAVRANPALEEAATFAMASPMAIQAAANMRRFGGARRR